MKSFLAIATLAACILFLPEDTPTPIPYEPTGDPATRVRDFIRGDRSTIDEADLYSPNVPESLRRAALELAN